MTDLPEVNIIEPGDLPGPVRSLFHLPQHRLDTLLANPGVKLLAETFAETEGTWLVGGAVRDLLLGGEHFDLDVTVDNDATEAAERIAAALPGRVRSHERFMTASYRSDDGTVKIDFARTRSEVYPHPGALPEVSPADIETDLARRDFSINAIAVALWREALGKVFEHPGGSADLKAGQLCVLHDESFRDDPTRLLRLLRYGARLGFAADAHTETLARIAVEEHVTDTVSGARIRDELLDLLGERLAVVAVEAMGALGLDEALAPGFEADEYVVSRALTERISGLRQDLLLLALCSRGMQPDALEAWLERLTLNRSDLAAVNQMLEHGPQLLERVAGCSGPGEVELMLRPLSLETAVFALALPGGDRDLRERLRERVQDHGRDVLEIDGSDLLARGVPEGPAVGRALADVLAATLDGQVSGREQQLEHALTRIRGGEEEA